MNDSKLPFNRPTSAPNRARLATMLTALYSGAAHAKALARAFSSLMRREKVRTGSTSKYTPHQGKAERARRRRQRERLEVKRRADS